ncbi:PTS beta-glucoside transporter subunit EIIBCA [Iocasia frigidifontis]|uniref:PTS beta-glucoside transporter subunit EIIBCA n=1 Tax=Iocasia fonsfrigidae TaxID=2682810 RepID=A0A8A7KCL4_9FIRM|nr:beta-glucoside-specific PTS transporter subunit IIABC [Iocasia fonsfrigidae]QTL98990.1 PTS beta-glucoside transporter subunit EIIBCA [Iocasia fonsfrigidae]
MDNRKLAKDILSYVGGINNIAQLANCATRLRMNFKDERLVDLEDLKKIDGVMDAIYKSGQYQIIIGTEVANVCEEMGKLGHISVSAEHSKQKGGKLERLMDILASIFTPVIPAITAAGMIKAILVIFVLLGMSKDSQVYSILSFVADAGFYFLPVMLGFSTAKKLGGNPYLAAMIGGILLHPGFKAMVTAGDPISFLGIPVKLVNYASSVIPIILAVWFMGYVERYADKISPKPIKFFTKPVLVILIVSPITLIVLGPLGSIIGTGIATVVGFLNTHVRWFVPTVMGAFMPLLVLTGMHWSFLPILLTSYSTYGYEAIMGPGSLVSNICQGAAALCVAIKSNNIKLKQLGYSSGITALMGITEPAMYGITLKLKKPLIAVMIGGASGGLYAGVMGVVRYTSGTPGLLSLPVFIGENPMNIVHAVISCIIGFIVTFILTWILGFEEPKDMGTENILGGESIKNKLSLNRRIDIYSPMEGQIIDINKVDDDSFANEVTGKGVAIIPKTGKVVAPFDGTATMVFSTKHAIGLTSEEGIELLIHVGIDTMELEGKHFNTLVKKGDTIKKGDPLLEFDKEAIEKEGYECTTPIVVTNSDDYLDVVGVEEGKVETGELIMMILEGVYDE